MASNILTTKRKPRAIAKEKDGIVFYWIDELNVAGIHQRGIVQLLECNADLVSDTVKRLKGVGKIAPIEAEVLTAGGIQGVGLISEVDLPKIFRAIARSKSKIEIRDRADDLRDKLAAAGLKLMVMLEVVPEKLKDQIEKHISESDKLLELERLRSRNKEIDGAMLTMHGAAWLALQGVGIAEIKTVVTEIVEPATGRTTEILTADQLKKAIKEKTGQNLKSLKWFADKLRAAGRDDLLVPVTRHSTNEYPVPSALDEAIAIVYGKERQQLIGES